jgi:hypothetical protein
MADIKRLRAQVGELPVLVPLVPLRGLLDTSLAMAHFLRANGELGDRPAQCAYYIEWIEDEWQPLAYDSVAHAYVRRAPDS